ncbi:MAG: M1 family metallopeptidase [Bacteroidales bacterium]|nr:M1 family metallopeptidase [Bacteroidales bacterium]
MKKTILFLISILLSVVLFSQEKYFQQQVNFNIKTELNPVENTLTSFETITYINNSPDTLEFIYFHLWPNAYKNRKTALSKQMAFQGDGKLFFDAKNVGGYIDSLDFQSKGKKLTWEYDKKNIDICKVYLEKPLLPENSVEITTPFYVKIPEDISRMGQSDSTYQITQWFPKPAVYDINGWHQMPYLNQGEFYSEFGNFDVYITVPKQYVVAATGNLQNNAEIKWLAELALTQSKGSELVNPVLGDIKTLHYSEQKIHDFAWFCSEKYYVDKDSVFTPNENRKVTTWAMYTDKNYFSWKKATKYVNNAVFYYSDWVGDYPYNNCTAVQGALSAGGGMEYPTITVISTQDIENVIFHEVGHNWFYGILGFDERRYPMLDEGINSFYDHRYSYEIKEEFPWFNFGSATTNDMPNPKAMSQMIYMVPAAFDMDQPLDLHSADYSKITYGTIVYEKMPEALIYLENYIGKSDFDKGMQTFYEDWKFQHPGPADFESYMRNSTDKNLDWFFNGIIETNGKIDYKIKFRNNKVILKNKGNFDAPVTFVAYDNDKNPVDTIWIDPFDKKIKLDYSKKDYSKFIIDPNFQTIDFNRYNNFTRTKGIFKRYEKFKIGFSTAIMNYYSYKINITPFVFYNQISKFQVGAFITNIKFPVKRFTFIAMPLYSFGYNELGGQLYLQYKTYGFNGFPAATYSFSLDRYAYYAPTHDFMPTPFKKMKFQVALNLQNPDGSNKYKKELKMSFSMIPKSVFKQKSLVSDRIANFASIFNVNFFMQKKSKLRPFMFKVNLDMYEQTYQLWAEAKYKIHYTSFYDGLKIRLFTGSNVPINGTDGRGDFKYDHFYWSRYRDYESDNGGLLSHQFVDEFGGLTYYYNSPEFFLVNAVNIQTTLPKIPVINFYYNFVSSANLQNGLGLNAFDFQTGVYEVGVLFDIIPNIIAIYMPLYGSQELMDYNKSFKEHWYQYFRFTFKIENFQEFMNAM